jgi:hypothetical protein
MTVSATIITASENSAFRCIANPNVKGQCYRTLLENQQNQLKRVVRGKRLLGTVTTMPLIITEGTSGEMSIDNANVCIAEDLEEAQMSNAE